jgi:hypothetical protein
MSKNRDIRGFFSKKASQAPSSTINSSCIFQPVPGSQQTHQPSPVLRSEPSLDLPSSPLTPKKNVKTPLTRDAEIRGSDDDDDDSDASLESLGEMFSRKSGAIYQKPAGLTATPKAKRISSGNFHRSPLTLQQQPKHKFDLKALLNHARQDHATDESVRRAKAARLQAEEDLEPEPDTDMMAGEVMINVGGTTGGKLSMAIDRTVGDESHPKAYFFDLEATSRPIPKRQFPTSAVKSKPWNILQTASSRDQMFIHGIPTVLARKGNELPDELYLWILDQVCVENDLQLLNQYISLIALCPENTRRLVDERRLYGMLEQIGGQKHSTIVERFQLSPGLSTPYPGKDWSPLRYFLELLAHIAPYLTPQNNIGAIKLLIRLSLDPIITTVAGLQVAHSIAVLNLVSALPTTEAVWNDCVGIAYFGLCDSGTDISQCNDICHYLCICVDRASQRNAAITVLPTSTSRTIELQRRMASAALLNNAGLGSQDPDVSVSIQDILARVSEQDFRVANSTDYGELNALLSLLDIVVHDGSYLCRALLLPPSSLTSTSSTTPSLVPTPSTLVLPTTIPSIALETEVRLENDANIDRLVAQLKVMHDKISDNTLISKKEVKLALDGMMKRLTNTVRSRPPPKTNIFERIFTAKEDVSLPKQKEFMKRWTAGRASKDEK